MAFIFMSSDRVVFFHGTVQHTVKDLILKIRLMSEEGQRFIFLETAAHQIYLS